MRERNVWLVVDGLVVALFAIALLSYARSAPQIAARGSLAAAVAPRVVAFAIVVGVFNGGLLLVGRVASGASAGDRLLSALAGGSSSCAAAPACGSCRCSRFRSTDRGYGPAEAGHYRWHVVRSIHPR